MIASAYLQHFLSGGVLLLAQSVLLSLSTTILRFSFDQPLCLADLLSFL